MNPKISTYFKFDYSDLLNKSIYAFLYKKGSKTSPYIILSEDKELNKCIGVSIEIYNNGIEINSDFSMPKDLVNTETLTKDANKLICDWLKGQGEETLINY